jgi:pimeloyl-ACP methyl ester carboxylesterase
VNHPARSLHHRGPGDASAASFGTLRRFHHGELSTTAVVAGAAGAAGALVVCLHGFPDNLHSFRHQLPALVEAGYQVVCPLLPGYEPSSQDPAVHYDMDSVADRLLALIRQVREELGLADQPLHLIGHDWGAIAGFAAVNKAPDLFRTFTSISIPYNLRWQGIMRHAPAYVRYAWYIQLFQLPLLPENLLLRRQGSFIDRLLRDWSPGWEMPQTIREGIKGTLAQPGVTQAALAYYRAIPGLSARARRARALLNDRIVVPTLFIEGTQDGCIHSHLWRLLNPASFSMGMKHAQVEAGHFPHQEQSQAVNRLLLQHLFGASS